MDLNIQHKVALVCAASKGLGKGAALSLAREGVNVAICARNAEKLQQTADEIRQETGVQVLAIGADLNQAADIQNIVDTTLASLGQIDILVTNIPHPKMGGFATLDEVDWQSGYETIFLPVLRLCQRIVPGMQKKQWGRVINISSYAIKEPNATYLLSGVFRTGIAVLNKSLANEYGQDGIRVNTVCPGLFHTDLGDGILQKIADRNGQTFVEAEAQMAAFTATKQLGKVEELAGLIAFLSSDFANHITGQVLMVEGGKAKGLL